MRKISALLLIVACVSICPGAAGAVDLEDGFMGIGWGVPAAEAGDLTKLYAKKDVDYYIDPHRVHTIAGIDVPNVVYGFYRDRFFAVYVGFDTDEVFGTLNRYMKSKYGVPDSSSSVKTGLTVYKWKYKDVKIKLKIRKDSRSMKLAFYHMPLAKQVNEEDLEMFHDKARRFFPIEKDQQPEMIPLLRF